MKKSVFFCLSVAFCLCGFIVKGAEERWPERFRGKVYKANVQPKWKGSTFWYMNRLADGKSEYIFVDAAKGERRSAFDAARLAQSLGEKFEREFDPEKLGLEQVDFDETGSRCSFRLGRERWQCDLNDYTINRQEPSEGDAAQPFPLQMKRSRSLGDSLFLTFINESGQPLTLTWINGEGGEQVYATLRPGAEHQQHTYAGHVWKVSDPEGRTLAILEAQTDGDYFRFTEEKIKVTLEAAARQPQSRSARPQSVGRRSSQFGASSPNGEWSVDLRDHNLYLLERGTGEAVALTRDGTEQDGYERPIFWSPDGRYFIALKIRKVTEREIYMVESSPGDQLQPKLHRHTYVKPGDELPYKRPRLFSVERKEEIPVSEELQSNPWDITEFRWSPDSREFYYLYNQRGHQRLSLLGIEAQTGKVRTVVEETSQTFIDYSNKTWLRPLFESSELLWMSERDGWNHLYLYDLEKGSMKRQITSGPWVVRRIEKADDPSRQLWFWAGGLYPEQDPYYLHLLRVNYDGTGLTRLTQGDGTHTVEFSPDGEWFLDRYSRVDMAPVTELRRSSDGALMCELERADASELLAAGWIAPERFVARGRDGQTDIYGVIIRPSHFDPAKSYPILEEIYAGPHGAFAPKAFGPETRLQKMAELGFIGVQLDGMGTNHRGKKFHDVCWKNLGDSGFPDRILWIKAAAEKYPYMDTERVGIYGGSAGGQSSTRALLAFGDFYKVAVSDCGCHDNRMDKIWWNEAWMGWPIGPEYAEQSNVTQAHRLTGKLFLTVGELDTNVDPASTMQVVNALIRANKDFEMLVIPGANHGAGELPYAARKREEFFVKHLLNGK
ncbi:MAG: DPP IV N-terminal domain-containing protein [Limisphaerales bacterium]|jgi:dipeptidyl-peptidase-4